MSSKRFPVAVAAHALRLLSLATLGVLPLAGVTQAAPAMSTVVAFSGSLPNGNLVVGSDGALYGTTASSAGFAGGLIYRTATDGSSVTTIYQLQAKDDGQTPQAGLLKAGDGRFYGTTKFGKFGSLDTTGTIFRIKQNGTEFAVLHRFAPFTASNVASSPKNTDGAFPAAELVEGSDGNLYGTTASGGADGTGVVFRIGPDGSGFAVLHAFSPVTTTSTDTLHKNVEGMTPVAPLVEAADGRFYGTASSGGVNGRGTIFRLNFDGTGFEVIHSFAATTVNSTTGLLENADGAGPTAGLVEGDDGFLYGVAAQGGTKGFGTLFRISPDGTTFTNLHDFDNNGGARPTAELALFSDGKLYGTTAAGGTNSSGALTSFGTLFSIARDGTGFATLHSLDGTAAGAGPASQLIQYSDTVILGMAAAGGTCGSGTIFRYDSSGGTVTGNTKCGRKKNGSNGYGGGSAGPALLLLLGGLALARRRRR